MTSTPDRVCIGCGDTEEKAHLELCNACGRFFCRDCAYKAGFGRIFCSSDCARAWYFVGDPDDDEDSEPDD